MQGILINHSGTSYLAFKQKLIQGLQTHLNQLLIIFDLLFQLGIHFVVLVLPVIVIINLPSICFFATSCLLLILGVPVNSLHHNVPILGIDPVVRVDVLLDGSARNPPLHNIAKRNTKSSYHYLHNFFC